MTSPLINETGMLAGIIEQFRDITDQEKVRLSLKEERDKYRSLFENVPVAIWEMDFSDLRNTSTNCYLKG
jgi:PAS domain-containing protein